MRRHLQALFLGLCLSGSWTLATPAGSEADKPKPMTPAMARLCETMRDWERTVEWRHPECRGSLKCHAFEGFIHRHCGAP